MDLLLTPAERAELDKLLTAAQIGWCTVTPAGAMVPIPVNDGTAWGVVEPCIIEDKRAFVVWLPIGCFGCSEEQEHTFGTLTECVDWLTDRL